MLALAALLGGLATPALARSSCGPGYDTPRELDLPAALSAPQPLLRHVWGRQNIRLLPAEAQGPVLRVLFPAGSINPGNRAAPVGGAGFVLPLGGTAAARCLQYRVRFPAGFDFARGGKLPGLAGGEAPRGCSAADLSAGFSARLMWRQDGDGELYLYAPDRSVRCGESIGRGAWRFPRGAWVTVAQEVALNRPGRADGAIRLWIDGRPVLERTGLLLAERPETRVDGLLFATFFGGSDASWASPRDQSVEFAGFALSEAAAR